MKPTFSIPPVDTKRCKIISGCTEYLYLYPDYIRIVSKGVIEGVNEDTDLPQEKIYDYDITIPRQSIDCFEYGWDWSEEVYQVTIYVGAIPPTLTTPDRETAKEIYLAIHKWYYK